MARRSHLPYALAIIVVGWASLAAPSDEMPKSVRADLEFLKALVARDPVKDARAAISQGKVEFLEVAGYTVTVPAGDESNIAGCLTRTDKVKLIRGTSDVVYGDEHKALIREATAYAARYNAPIATERGLSTVSRCWPSNSGVQRPPAERRR